MDIKKIKEQIVTIICKILVCLVYPAVYYIIRAGKQDICEPREKSGISNKRSGATPPAKQ
jgi:hypothetical protein